jgi:DNA-binding NtrC family response regulator
VPKNRPQANGPVVVALASDGPADAQFSRIRRFLRQGRRASVGAAVAQARTHEQRPDSGGLVLTDLKMPGMGGVELLEKVRAQHEDTIMVVMTAFGAVDTEYQSAPKSNVEAVEGASKPKGD